MKAAFLLVVASVLAGCAGNSQAPAAGTPEAPASSARPADTSISPTTPIAEGSAGAARQALAPTPSTVPVASATAAVPDSGRSRDDIAAAVVALRPRARACYDRAEAAHPGIEGNLVIGFTIDPKGDVKDMQVDAARTTIADAAVGPCVIDVMKSLKFPPSAKGFETKASYPFNFVPKRVAPVVAPPKG
jgi:TonB family protein